MSKKKNTFTGIAAFVIVLFSMPLGHAAMILMEHFLTDSVLNFSAFLMGCAGVGLTLWGDRSRNNNMASLLGFFGGLLVWTGWIEFGYVYFAKVLSVAPLMENGEIVTKPEYLVLMSSVGFWAVVMLFYIFRLRSQCNMFIWVQQKLSINTASLPKSVSVNKSWTTFMETIMLLWTSYLVLMFAYDKKYLGDDHPVTLLLAVACLLCSLWMFNNLRKIGNMGYAIRYALPTVIIFWTFVEVLGRIEWLSEFWVEPIRYKFEILLLTVSMAAGIVFIVLKEKQKRKTRKQ